MEILKTAHRNSVLTFVRLLRLLLSCHGEACIFAAAIHYNTHEKADIAVASAA